jgi:protein TonB
MHLTDPKPTDGDSFSASERRRFARILPNSLSYVNLDETNGGILLNVSETGLAVQAAMNVMEDVLPDVRLQVPRSKTWLEGSARVVWTSDSRKIVGIEFQHLPDDARKQLSEWLTAEGAVSTQPASVAEAPPESEFEVPPPAVETVPVARPAALLPVEPEEIDYSTLLFTSGHASSIPLPAQTSPPAVRTVRAATPPLRPVEKIPVPVEHLAAAKSSDLRSRYAPIIAALAILSLAAGWEAGRGNMLQSVFGIFESSSAAAPLSTDGSLPRGSVNPASLSFLVVDVTNQSWLVPFAGPTSAPPSSPIPALPPQTRANESGTITAPKAIRQWTLAAPQNTNRASNIENAMPAPQLSTPQGNGINALSAAIPGVIGAQVPAPPTSTYSNLVSVTVVHRIDPVYPQAAIQQRVEGTVRVHARISETGVISDVSALDGSPLLQAAAVNAVRKWTFKPEVLDGRAVASDFDVNIRFTLPQ